MILSKWKFTSLEKGLASVGSDTAAKGVIRMTEIIITLIMIFLILVMVLALCIWIDKK